MLDKDLAELYEVETWVLNQAVKRNLKRFPADFMFQLTRQEWDDLRYQIDGIKNTAPSRSQIVTLKITRNKRRILAKTLLYETKRSSVTTMSIYFYPGYIICLQ